MFSVQNAYGMISMVTQNQKSNILTDQNLGLPLRSEGKKII